MKRVPIAAEIKVTQRERVCFYLKKKKKNEKKEKERKYIASRFDIELRADELRFVTNVCANLECLRGGMRRC